MTAMTAMTAKLKRLTFLELLQAIMDEGGTLLIGATYNSQCLLPPNWPQCHFEYGFDKEIKNLSAHDISVSKLLFYTMSVADAAAALEKSENAILRALRHGALGGLRVRGVWRASKFAVETAKRKSGETDHGTD